VYLVKMLDGVVDQLKDATTTTGTKPFLVVTTGLTGPTKTKLTRFLQAKDVGAELRAINEKDILETARRLRKAFGLPEKLPSEELPGAAPGVLASPLKGKPAGEQVGEQ
jgi:hypothetical protein